MSSYTQNLKKANEILKAGSTNLTIEQRGSKLLLRGTFPPRPNSKLLSPHQQRLTLNLPATDEGLQTAKHRAKEISGQLALGKFRWDDHINVDDTTYITIGDAVKTLEKNYFNQREKNEKSLLTWREDYLKPFHRLPLEQPLTVEILESVILETKPDTRQRKRFVSAYSFLADKFKLEHDLKELKGRYSPKAVNPRQLPSDELIADYYQSIPNPNWQWAYGMMACYGLRNHELFFVDLKDFPVCFVLRGKTNERYCYPLYPEWAESWDLKTVKTPECSGQTNGDYGSRVTHAFYRYNIPFPPYNLRHSWARRAFEFEFEPSLSARLMGHSLKVHCQTYQRWIDEKFFRLAYDRIISQSNRPLPPN